MGGSEHLEAQCLPQASGKPSGTEASFWEVW